MIFLSITGSFFATLAYDRRQKKAVQKKWCDLVSHVAQDTLPVNQLPRKITVFLSAPPGDGIRPSRDYFRQYIKPVLVAAAMDYDVIEGRKEGQVRYGTAEQIRRLRRKQGEVGEKEEEMDVEKAIDLVREKMLVANEPGIKGDLVLGRHTWKEYIRGLHEGWLGPLDEPVPPVPDIPAPSTDPTAEDSQHPDKVADEKKPEEKKPEDDKKPASTPPAYISTNSYPLASLPPTIPSLLEPSQPLHQQHILGFLKTPQRIYNFLTRRYLADEIGRQTAAIVLAAHRPYQQTEPLVSDLTPDDVDDPTPLATRTPENDQQRSPPNLSISDPAERAVLQTAAHWEQQSALAIEEKTWHKSVRKPAKDTTFERVWLDKVVIDPRIGQRMRKFELSPEEEERAARIGRGEESSRAVPVQDLRKVQVVVGDVDSDDY